MSGYIRTDVTDQIANGNNVDAIPLDTEFNAVVTAFAAVGGHAHGGAIGEGAPITVIGPSQNIVASANSLTPSITNTVDLGTLTQQYKNVWIDGVADIDSLVADTADINAGTIDNTIIGATTRASVSATTVNANAGITGSLTGDVTGNITSAGTSTFTTADINGGTIDATPIGLTTPSTAAVSNLSVSGTITLTGVALTPTAAQYNFVTGATSNLQTQLNAKQATLTGAVTTIASSDLTASRALASDVSGKVAVSVVTSAELGHLTGVTSAIQTQLGTKQATITGAATTVTASDLTASRALTSDGTGKIVASGVTATEVGRLTGVTSALQTQLDSKQTVDSDLTALAGVATTGLLTRTGAGTATTRSLVAGDGIVITNSDGVAGNPTVAALSGEASVQITGSPTAIDFTSLPSYVTKISVVVNAVSLSTANTIQVRIGSGGAVDATGYVGGCVTVDTSTNAAGSTTGFLLATDSAAQSVNGILMLVKEPAFNSWFVSAVLNVTTTGRTLMCSGQKSIAGALTNLQFVASGGVFDAGRITITYS